MFVEASTSNDPIILDKLVELLVNEDDLKIQNILSRLSLSHTLHYYLSELLYLAKSLDVSPNTLVKLIDIAAFTYQKTKRVEPKISPVWTGPTFSTSPIKHKTYETIKKMFESAQNEIIIVGYTFSLDNPIVSSLMDKLIEASNRGCRINIIFHKNTTNQERILNSWPNNIRLPYLYFWKGNRNLGTTSLHSKLICIDQNQLLVTSANFTLNGLERNIETGLLIQNDRSIQIIWQQFRSLLNNREIVEI
jgi:phosphatidylserine/phosphatidylglycerophosphate/cardiolipin synthase-like enzyme